MKFLMLTERQKENFLKERELWNERKTHANGVTRLTSASGETTAMNYYSFDDNNMYYLLF